MPNNFDLKEFKLEDWMPVMPMHGPPLPRILGIFWPWYEAEVPPPYPFLKLYDLNITPKEVQIGNPVSISCTAENIGSETGSKTIELKIGGEVVATREVTLAPGDSEVVSFEVTPDVARTYSVSVDGLHGSFKATEVVPPADIRVENLEITPSEVKVGEVVTISCRATNYGNASGSRVVECLVD